MFSRGAGLEGIKKKLRHFVQVQEETFIFIMIYLENVLGTEQEHHV